MTFLNPQFLLLLFLLPLCLLLAKWWWKRFERHLTSFSRHARSVPPRAQFQVVVLIFGLAALIIALAGPAWGTREAETVQRSRNVMLAVDVSRSMLAEDVRPNRLRRAKADLIDLVDALEGDRAGLLAFRGKGALLCPMTTDKAFLRQNIDALAPDSAPPGETDLADAIAKCLETFELAQSAHNAIVLISDGEDLAGQAKSMAAIAGERRIPIFTVGIGSSDGAAIPMDGATVMYEGKVVKSRLTEQTLREIAEVSGGRYIPLATAGTAQTTLGAVYARYLSRLADEEVREFERISRVDRTGLFAGFATICFLIVAGCSLGRIRLGKFFLVGLMCWGGALVAQEPAREAQHYYRANRFADAAAQYATARAGAEPSEIPHYAYNEALALWKAGDITNALNRVQMAVDNRLFTARAATLEGVLQATAAAQTDVKEEQLALRLAAADAFARALRAEPSDEARRNLSRVTANLDQLKSEARKAAALKRYKDVPLQQMLPQILNHQRALMRAVPEVYSSTDPEVLLSQAEQLVVDVAEQYDRWYPIMEQLPQAVTNETACQELLRHAQTAQAQLEHATQCYEALDRDARYLVEGEPIAYDFWKLVAQPAHLIDEAIAVQTNAMTSLTSYQPTREDEPEVLNLVQQFRVIFPQWAEDYLKQQAASTNKTEFTEATRDRIARTADATVPLLSPPIVDETKQKIMDNLLLIQKLLPKDPNQQQSSQSQQQQNPQQNQQQQQSEASQEQPQEASQSPQREQQEANASESENIEQEELEALLQKAADREREHEEEKRKRAWQQVPTNVRDW